MRSLKSQLATGLTLALLIVFVVQFLLVRFSIQEVTRDYMLERMSRDVDSLLAALVIDAEGTASLSREPLTRAATLAYSGQYYRIDINEQQLRSRSLWDHELKTGAPAPGDSSVLQIAGPQNQPLLILSRSFIKSHQLITITVAEDLTDNRAGLGSLLQRYLIVAIVCLILLVLFQLWLLQRAIRSLTSTRLDLNRITRGEAERLPEEVPDEIQPLVTEVNHLLKLLTQRLQRTRTAVGNLAHALKTPLSVLTRIAENPNETEFNDGLRNRMQTQLTGIRNSLERELNLARLAGDSRSGKRFHPGEDLQALVDTLHHIHTSKDLEIQLNIDDDRPWLADREDMLELFGNLLDNACKWAQGKVHIHLPEQHTAIIEDDGPGANPEDLQTIMQRGTRLDEQTEGHGLGLSIVREILEQYRGEIQFEAGDDMGGVMVRVRLLFR